MKLILRIYNRNIFICTLQTIKITISQIKSYHKNASQSNSMLKSKNNKIIKLN